MHTLTVKEGDYILLGEDTFVYFDYKTDRNALMLSIDAPRHVEILRSKPYEQALAHEAEGGNAAAAQQLTRLKRDRQKMYKKTAASRQKRDEQEQRMANGEIKRYNA